MPISKPTLSKPSMIPPKNYSLSISRPIVTSVPKVTQVIAQPTTLPTAPKQHDTVQISRPALDAYEQMKKTPVIVQPNKGTTIGVQKPISKGPETPNINLPIKPPSSPNIHPPKDEVPSKPPIIKPPSDHIITPPQGGVTPKPPILKPPAGPNIHPPKDDLL